VAAGSIEGLDEVVSDVWVTRFFILLQKVTEIPYRDFHLTLAMLLHYLAKSENATYSCFKDNPFLFS